MSHRIKAVPATMAVLLIGSGAAGCGYDFGGVVFADTASSGGGAAVGSAASSSAGGGDTATASASNVVSTSVSSGNGGGGGAGAGGGATGAGGPGGGDSTTTAGGEGGATTSDGGSTGSSGGDGGSAGQGSTSTGSTECTVAGDCPSVEAECCVPDCEVSLTCGQQRLVTGAACGDGQICSDAGACVACLDETDCPFPTSPCRIRACDAGSCEETSLGVGSPCVGSALPGFCAGPDLCVECTSDTHCINDTLYCELGRCRPVSCGNQAKDEGEVATDCGGPACRPCDDGAMNCLQPRDCVGQCTAGNPRTCAGCTDSNQCETGRRCVVGRCLPERAQGTACGAAAECITGICSGDGVCCDDVCTGVGSSCLVHQTGQPNGTCADALPSGPTFGPCGP